MLDEGEGIRPSHPTRQSVKRLLVPRLLFFISIDVARILRDRCIRPGGLPYRGPRGPIESKGSTFAIALEPQPAAGGSGWDGCMGVDAYQTYQTRRTTFSAYLTRAPVGGGGANIAPHAEFSR